jgi:hypothetical protein
MNEEIQQIKQGVKGERPVVMGWVGCITALPLISS